MAEGVSSWGYPQVYALPGLGGVHITVLTQRFNDKLASFVSETDFVHRNTAFTRDRKIMFYK